LKNFKKFLFLEYYLGGCGLYAHSSATQKQQKQTTAKELPPVALSGELL